MNQPNQSKPNCVFLGLQNRINTSVPLVLVNYTGPGDGFASTQGYNPDRHRLTAGCARTILFKTAGTKASIFINQLMIELTLNKGKKLREIARQWRISLQELFGWAHLLEKAGRVNTTPAVFEMFGPLKGEGWRNV